MGNWSNMSWKARIAAILGALAAFAVSIGLITDEEGADATSCVSAALANVDENYHPWLDEGCQAVAQRLIESIAQDWGAERVEDILHAEEEPELETDGLTEPEEELESADGEEG